MLASLFLLYSAGKSSLTLFFAVLALTSLTAVVRSFWLRVVMLLTPLILLNLLSIGTVMSDGLAEIAKLLPLDSSFTGRTDIWTFALQSLQAATVDRLRLRRVLGQQTRSQNLPQGKEWAEYASHSHNGYLDTALAMGLPGLALLIAVLVIAPLRNFQGADAVATTAAGDGAAADLAVRDLSVVDGKLLPRPLRSALVHVSAGGVRPALSGAVPRQGVKRSAAPLSPAPMSCHQPSKSNGTCTDGHFSAETILSA